LLSSAQEHGAHRHIYLCGNSLGLQPKACRALVLQEVRKRGGGGVGFEEETDEEGTASPRGLTFRALPKQLDKWAQVGVEGHFSGDFPWATIDEIATPGCAALVGAGERREVRCLRLARD
jgi:kynureninase